MANNTMYVWCHCSVPFLSLISFFPQEKWFYDWKNSFVVKEHLPCIYLTLIPSPFNCMVHQEWQSQDYPPPKHFQVCPPKPTSSVLEKNDLTLNVSKEVSGETEMSAFKTHLLGLGRGLNGLCSCFTCRSSSFYPQHCMVPQAPWE